jgi:hypothetical protein
MCSHLALGQLLEVFPCKGRVFMVLEKGTTDLDKVIKNRFG